MSERIVVRERKRPDVREMPFDQNLDETRDQLVSDVPAAHVPATTIAISAAVRYRLRR